MIAPTRENVKSALASISPDCTRKEWVKILCAVEDGLGDDGRDLAEEWSANGSSYVAFDFDQAWRSIGPGDVTIGTLWRTAQAEGWAPGEYVPETPEERAAREAKREEARRRREEEAQRVQAQTAELAARVIGAAAPATGRNPYLTRKKVAPTPTLYELDAAPLTRLLGYSPRAGGDQLTGRILVAPVRRGKTLVNVEMIDGAGRKTALKGRGTKAGAYWEAAELPESDGPETLYVGEGVATTLSIAQAAPGGYYVAALSATNLKNVAVALRERYPTRPIVICADLNDAEEPIAAARDAAEAIGAALVAPAFDVFRQKGDNDFNDLYVREGARAVLACLLTPTSTTTASAFAPVKRRNPLLPSQPVEVEAGTEVEAEEVVAQRVAAGGGGTALPPNVTDLQTERERRAQPDGEPAFDDDDPPDATADDQRLIRVTARRKALRGESADQITRALRRQFPAAAHEAERAANAALAWAAQFKPGAIFEWKGIKRRATNTAELAERYARVELPGIAGFVVNIADGLPISATDLGLRLSGEVIVASVNANGAPVVTPAHRAWLECYDKRIYTEMAFTSDPVEDHVYNLFRGFGCKPAPGDCSLILKHVEDVICSGDKVAYDAFLNLLAWQFQNVGQQSRVVVVLFSERHQTGKGTLQALLTDIAGPLHGLSTADAEHSFGKFNDAMRGKIIVALDEACFAGDKKLADRVKSISATPTFRAEAKGLPNIPLPNGANLFLATNHRHAAHVEIADARYWTIAVSEDRANDRAYFAALHSEIKSGGREAFLHFLLNRDVTGFIPARDVPRDNELLRENKSLSLGVGHPVRWIEQCLEYETLLGADLSGAPWVPGAEKRPIELHKLYLAWLKSLPGSPSGVPMGEFWEALTKIGFVADDGARSSSARVRIVPSLEEAKEGLESYFSGTKRTPGQ